jgi:ferric-dicitrate binding protein FerR (iron transport regulator)
MQPGQVVEVSERTRQLTKKTADPARYLAWTHNKLVFDNTSLGEIAQLLAQDYGYQVIFADKNLAALRLTASFEIKGLDSILETLAGTFNLRIEKQKQKIIISKPKVNQSSNSITQSNNPITYAK